MRKQSSMDGGSWGSWRCRGSRQLQRDLIGRARPGSVRRKAVSKNRRSNGRPDNSPLPSLKRRLFHYILSYSEIVIPHPISAAHPSHLHTSPGHVARPLRLRLHGFSMSGNCRSSLTTCDIDTDLIQQAPNQPRPYPGNYLPNGGAPGGPSGPAPGAVPLLPNQGRVIQQGSVRVLCIADVRGEGDNNTRASNSSLTSVRKPAIAKPARRRRPRKLHHPHRRLWLLRRPLARSHRREDSQARGTVLTAVVRCS